MQISVHKLLSKKLCQITAIRATATVTGLALGTTILATLTRHVATKTREHHQPLTARAGTPRVALTTADHDPPTSTSPTSLSQEAETITQAVIISMLNQGAIQKDLIRDSKILLSHEACISLVKIGIRVVEIRGSRVETEVAISGVALRDKTIQAPAPTTTAVTTTKAVAESEIPEATLEVTPEATSRPATKEALTTELALRMTAGAQSSMICTEIGVEEPTVGPSPMAVIRLDTVATVRLTGAADLGAEAHLAMDHRRPTEKTTAGAVTKGSHPAITETAIDKVNLLTSSLTNTVLN